MSAGWVRKDFPKPYHREKGLRMQNEEGGGAARGGTWNRGTRCWTSWNRTRSGVYGIRQGTMAGHARTIGALTRRCDNNDDDDDDAD